LQLIKVPVTNFTVSETLQNHPYYPSLLSISDSLRNWHVDNYAFHLPKEKLDELTLPFVAHCYTKQGEAFLLVKKITDTHVGYLSGSENVSASKDAFVDMWSGIALFAERTEISGEKGYLQNKRKEKLSTLKVPFLLMFTLFVSLFSIVSFHHTATSFIVTLGYTILLFLLLLLYLYFIIYIYLYYYLYTIILLLLYLLISYYCFSYLIILLIY